MRRVVFAAAPYASLMSRDYGAASMAAPIE
jgi:hypothetical protein